jgi:hypothetical protein
MNEIWVVCIYLYRIARGVAVALAHSSSIFLAMTCIGYAAMVYAMFGMHTSSLWRRWLD